MKKHLISITLFFLILITALMLFYSGRLIQASDDYFYDEQLVDLNEMLQLSRQDNAESDKKLEQARKEFEKKQDVMRMESNTREALRNIWILYGICVMFLLIIFIYVYGKILRPFEKLQNYADEIAKGNLELDLKYERTNYFGQFTWAFDHMRREITKARACEKEAIDNNKTVMATLSHDIKTPIASIRAYAEGLDANLDSGPEIRRKYSSVIMKKCDEVTKLTNDLFLHSLSDLDKLRMNPDKVNLKKLFDKIQIELQLSDNKVVIEDEIPEVTVMIDAKRFEQVIENLINNAQKYAPESRININVGIEEDNLVISVRDYGQGIPDEDIPFIFEKFYRGRNVGDKQGSGLGLYIVRYIMQQMGGSVNLANTSDGLKVNLYLPYSS